MNLMMVMVDLKMSVLGLVVGKMILGGRGHHLHRCRRPTVGYPRCRDICLTVIVSILAVINVVNGG